MVSPIPIIKFERKSVAKFTEVIWSTNEIKTKLHCGGVCIKNNSVKNQNVSCNAFQYEGKLCKIGNINSEDISTPGNEKVHDI